MKVSIIQDIVIKQTRRKEGHKKKDGRAEGRRCPEGEQESKADKGGRKRGRREQERKVKEGKHKMEEMSLKESEGDGKA